MLPTMPMVLIGAGPPPCEGFAIHCDSSVHMHALMFCQTLLKKLNFTEFQDDESEALNKAWDSA